MTLAGQPLTCFGVAAPHGLSVPGSEVSPAVLLGHTLALFKAG